MRRPETAGGGCASTDACSQRLSACVGSLRFHVAALRRKLEDVPADPRHVVTETGVGYRLLLEPW